MGGAGGKAGAHTEIMIADVVAHHYPGAPVGCSSMVGRLRSPRKTPTGFNLENTKSGEIFRVRSRILQHSWIFSLLYLSFCCMISLDNNFNYKSRDQNARDVSNLNFLITKNLIMCDTSLRRYVDPKRIKTSNCC